MGFLDDIKNAIFGGPAKAAEPKAAEPKAAEAKPAETRPAEARPAAPAPAPAGAQPSAIPAGGTAATPTPVAPAPAPAAPAPSGSVDVGAILDSAVKTSGQELEWRKSIVDLMKALGIDSSLTARKALAAELGYTGDTSDSAMMNVWLHQQVIQKLRDNGGKVPADLLD